MKEYEGLIRLSLWSLYWIIGYKIIGFELVVVMGLALISFNMIERTSKENPKIENLK